MILEKLPPPQRHFVLVGVRAVDATRSPDCKQWQP